MEKKSYFFIFKKEQSQERFPNHQIYDPSLVYQQYRPDVRVENGESNVNKPVDSLLNIYLNKEGIDRRYSRLIMQELHDATELSNDQLNQAADELITSNVVFNASSATTPKNENKSSKLNSNPNV